MSELESTQEFTKPPKPMTLLEHRKMMGKLFTVRRDTVEACGHKFYGELEPKNNCPSCWAAYFFINGETSALADEIYQKEGRDMLIRVRGEKFTKWFVRFMSEIQKLHADKRTD